MSAPIPPLFLNQQPIEAAAPSAEGQWAELSATPPTGALLQLQIAGTTLEPFLRPGDPTWYWRWQAPHAAGLFPLTLTLQLTDGSTLSYATHLVVAARKLDAEQHARLLADLEQLGRALVVALHGGAHAATINPEPTPQPLAPHEALPLLFGRDFARLVAAIQRIARRPPDQLRPSQQHIPLGELRDAADLVALHPAYDEATLAAPSPSYVSYEARLLRRLLERLARRADLLAQTGLAPAQAAQLGAAQAQLRGLQALAFLTDVPPLTAYHGPSVRMQRDPDYRVVYQYWRLLQRQPMLAWDAATLRLPIAALPLLYERWCVVRVALALLELRDYTLHQQTILVADPEAALLRLPTNQPLLSLVGANGLNVQLRYQPRYQPVHAAEPHALGSLDRHTRIPDLALELQRADGHVGLIILDAKYRLEASGSLPEAALADAYSYLGAIGNLTIGSLCQAVALLYPGHGPSEVYASGVAALPLLPGNGGQALSAWLQRGLR